MIAVQERCADSPTVALSAAAVADVALALAGALPLGQILGDPIASSEHDPAGRISVRVTPHQLTDPVHPGAVLVLRDAEQTPLAELAVTSIQDEGGDRVLCGTVRALRLRESGFGARHRLELGELPAGQQGLLFVLRPPTQADTAAIIELLSRPGQARVLVPEGNDDPAGVPTITLVKLAELALRECGMDAPVRTVPLWRRDRVSDAHLVNLVARRLGSTATLVLDEQGPQQGALEWSRSREVLLSGTGNGALPGIPAQAAEVLRKWRPPRTSRGLVLMFTGLSGSGKSTLARDVYEHIACQTARTASLLDGDVVRRLLSSGLGFDRASRELNVRRIGFVAAEVARHGGIALCSPIAPFAMTRAEVRHMVETVGDFVLVHVSTPLAECERRDLKGLYALARAGALPEFTGISSPYEVPDDADLRVDTTAVSRQDAAGQVLDLLISRGWLEGARA